MRQYSSTALALTLSLIAVPALAAQQATVYRSPSCGCCEGWVAYLKSNGFDATAVSTDDLGAIKAKMNVPADMQSCHTATIAGYGVEGHAPIEAIARLLAERPHVTGIAVPGMPGGSPGMPGPKEPFTVFTFGPAGETEFMRF
ncbi:hypothetical protein DFR50_10487 [Roseiarcus fermentans]|uniref:CopG family transcriptional regulator n=1 Tax=Roseiarcus fermentans TaxID=1473586 RepID=A0A366FRX4_9HYPH|nr:DUF411 domain-containing protein [Roseiarcus fermentans]RBP16810.1 hypothetical protein DFR50_10487 [Roseiarcus fermentans]